MYSYCFLLSELLDEDDDEDEEEDEDNEGGAGLGGQNKVLKSEVSKHKQQLESLQQKVMYFSPLLEILDLSH